MRLVLLLSVVLLAGVGIYVVNDRSRLATRIEVRQASYRTCSKPYKGSNERARRANACGWSQLARIRRGDLTGVPFLALAVALSILLAYKIAHPSSGVGAIKVGDSRADDPLI
jgi:hypothetical protein